MISSVYGPQDKECQHERLADPSFEMASPRHRACRVRLLPRGNGSRASANRRRSRARIDGAQYRGQPPALADHLRGPRLHRPSSSLPLAHGAFVQSVRNLRRRRQPRAALLRVPHRHRHGRDRHRGGLGRGRRARRGADPLSHPRLRAELGARLHRAPALVLHLSGALLRLTTEALARALAGRGRRCSQCGSPLTRRDRSRSGRSSFFPSC